MVNNSRMYIYTYESAPGKGKHTIFRMQIICSEKLACCRPCSHFGEALSSSVVKFLAGGNRIQGVLFIGDEGYKNKKEEKKKRIRVQ